ncbi:MAG: hypothetical protein U1F43_29215 [Myxococcota bacterium]
MVVVALSSALVSACSPGPRPSPNCLAVLSSADARLASPDLSDDIKAELRQTLAKLGTLKTQADWDAANDLCIAENARSETIADDGQRLELGPECKRMKQLIATVCAKPLEGIARDDCDSLKKSAAGAVPFGARDPSSAEGPCKSAADILDLERATP